MSEPCALGIDLGGTSAKIGLVTADATVLARNTVPIDRTAQPHAILDTIHSASAVLLSAYDVPSPSVVGIGAPGPLDIARTRILRSVNFPAMRDVPVVQELSRRFSLPVVLENDANVAALGEQRTAEGAPDSLVLFTLGTGIGGGIVLGGEIYAGSAGGAGELGHMIVEPGGRQCACGQRGCLERYSSATAIVSAINASVAESSAKDGAEAVALVQRGDPAATRAWREACRYLALACVNLQQTIDPAWIVLGGGLSAARDLLLNEVRAARDELIWSMTPARAELRVAERGNDAGMIGAALHALANPG